MKQRHKLLKTAAMKLWVYRIPAIILCLAISVAAGVTAEMAADCRRVRDSVLRLHIVANSDTQADQEVKLLVRDEIVLRSAELFQGDETREDAISDATSALSELERVAEEVLRAEGFHYTAKASVVNMYFPTKDYEEFVLPAGEYDALRIELGDAQGENWWCVVYPPLCLGASTAEIPLSDELPTREGWEVRLWVVDWVEGLKNR